MAEKHIPLSIHRLEAFSDGVIAIVITLMIFGIKVPVIPNDASGKEIWESLKPTLDIQKQDIVSVLCALENMVDNMESFLIDAWQYVTEPFVLLSICHALS